MKKFILMMFALLALVSFSQASAQTSTSSSYILGASTREYLTPSVYTGITQFPGFGVNMTPDTCLGYSSVAADISKILAILSSQIDQNVRAYAGASCNIQTTLDANCTKYVDTINNLSLTYATYQLEGLVQAKDKAYVCDASNNRIPNRYRKSYYNIDLVALTYASVRDAYAGKTFYDSGTLINNINTNLVSKLNNAIAANRFADVIPAAAIKTTYTAPIVSTTTIGVRAPRQRVVTAPVQYDLRTLGQKTFKTATAIRLPRQRVVVAPPTTILSGRNMFLFFGLTDNVNNRTISAIPFYSLAEYVLLYNANPTRFGEIFSVTNKPLIDNGANVLRDVNASLDRMIPRQGTSTVATVSEAQLLPAQSQKAFVGGAVGNLLASVWNAINSFLSSLFGAKEAGAVGAVIIQEDSGSGPYPEICPGLKGSKPAPSLSVPLQRDRKSGKLILNPSEDARINTDNGIFHNLFVLNSDIKEVVWESTYVPSGSMPILTPEEKTWLIRSRYISDNIPTKTTKEVPEKSVSDIQRSARDAAMKHMGESKTSYKTNLDNPKDPYDCLREFDFYFDFMSDYNNDIVSSTSGIRNNLIPYVFSSIKVTVTALNQTASSIFDTKKVRYLDILAGKSIEKYYSDVKLEWWNKNNTR